MEQEKFNQRLETLKGLGRNANMAIFACSEKDQQMAIFLPNEKDDSVSDVSAKLAKIFRAALSSTEKNEDKRQFVILRDAMAAAVLPYVNGFGEEELTALGLLGI